MIVFVKQKNSNRLPFEMTQSSAERFIENNPNFEILGGETIAPVQKITKKKRQQKAAVRKD